jgi:hypothetical protein
LGAVKSCSSLMGAFSDIGKEALAIICKSRVR